MSSDAASTTHPPPPEQGLEIRSHFVRSRNVLVTRAEFSELYVDYFLHLSTYHLQLDPAHVALFKDALAAFLLHCAARPRHEIVAWTLHFEEPMVNLFLTADNEEGTVIGRVLAENVREMGGNHLYADVVAYGKPPRRSAVPFAGADPFRAAEAFYLQSEQRPARIFPLAPEEFALVGSHPDCDTAWFEALTPDQVRDLEKTETVSLLERRRYEWRCGCDQRKLLRVLAQVARKHPEEIFGDDASAQVSCPRCGAKHVITREAMEAYLASHPE
ncbi:MAG: Hsp33 family molecular chaperone HslO [Opitutaceae bacterium]